MGGAERTDRQERVPVVCVLEQALFEDPAELRPHGVVLLAVIGPHVLDRRENFLGQPPPDGLDLPVLLQDLARDVERQVLCIDEPLDETQVLGHQLFAVVHDEHALDVELDAGAAFAHEQVERCRGRDEEQGLVLEGALGLHRDDLERLVPRVADVPVEVRVLLVGHLRPGSGPQRLLRVEHLRGGGLGRLVGVGGCVIRVVVAGDLRRHGSGHVHADRPGDEVGVLLDQLTDLGHRGVVVQIVLGVLGLEVQRHRGALRCLGDVLDRVRARACRFPPRRGGLAGLAGQQGDLVGHHERRVEADAELADELLGGARARSLGLFCLFQLATDIGRTRLRERADEVDDLVARHADPVVGDGECPGVGIQ